MDVVECETPILEQCDTDWANANIQESKSNFYTTCKLWNKQICYPPTFFNHVPTFWEKWGPLVISIAVALVAPMISSLLTHLSITSWVWIGRPVLKFTNKLLGKAWRNVTKSLRKPFGSIDDIVTNKFVAKIATEKSLLSENVPIPTGNVIINPYQIPPLSNVPI